MTVLYFQLFGKKEKPTDTYNYENIIIGLNIATINA